LDSFDVTCPGSGAAYREIWIRDAEGKLVQVATIGEQVARALLNDVRRVVNLTGDLMAICTTRFWLGYGIARACGRWRYRHNDATDYRRGRCPCRSSAPRDTLDRALSVLPGWVIQQAEAIEAADRIAANVTVGVDTAFQADRVALHILSGGRIEVSEVVLM